MGIRSSIKYSRGYNWFMLLEYFRWHYGRGFGEFVDICRNILIFLFHFFSFRLLLATLFSPWKRMGEHYEKGLHIESIASTFIVNTIMRVVGFVARGSILLLGSVIVLVFLVLSFAGSVIWLLMPLCLVALLASAFFLILAAL